MTTPQWRRERHRAAQLRDHGRRGTGPGGLFPDPVASGGIGRAVSLVIVQKQLADRPIGKAPYSCGVTEVSNFEIEVFSGPTVGQAITGTHRRTLASSPAQTRHGRSPSPLH